MRGNNTAIVVKLSGKIAVRQTAQIARARIDRGKEKSVQAVLGRASPMPA